MSELPEIPDLKFLPDWLKESEATGNRYANYEGEPERRERPSGGGPRPFGRGGPGGPGGPGRGDRGPRPGGGPPGRGGPRPGGPRSDRGPRPGGDRRPGPAGARRDDRGERRPEYQPVEPAAVKVEFLPEPGAVAAVAKQIRSTHRAFPLFGTGRLFLERTERHRVRLTSLNPEAPLYQVADGPIALDRALVDRDAFRVLKIKYYKEETTQGDPPKGNFSNVARLRTSGLLIGPTNHHNYQPSLRRIFEERYSRRMGFAEFQQREIVVVNDEQAINDWKEQARTTVTWTTTQEAEPSTFKSLVEVEAHFRQHYLAAEMKCAPTLEANGAAMRTSPDRALIASICDAIERERGFPAGIVNAMRPALTEAGLHFFKHRKRVVFVSTIRPLPHPVGQPAKDTVAKILATIESTPRCTRHDLAVKLIGKDFESQEKSDEKTALAADLHYLLLAGHVIEFTDGKFDLPLQPKAQAEAEARSGKLEREAPPEPVSAGVASTPEDKSPVQPAAAADQEESAEVSPAVPQPEPEQADVLPLAEHLPPPSGTATESVQPTVEGGPFAEAQLSNSESETPATENPPSEAGTSSSTAPSSSPELPDAVTVSVAPAEASPEFEPVPELVSTSGETIPPPAAMAERDQTSPPEENPPAP